MHQEMTITSARSRLNSLSKNLEKQRCAVTVTRKGKPVLAILPWGFYESLVETIEIMGNPELMKQLRASLKDIKEKRLIPWEKVKQELKL